VQRYPETIAGMKDSGGDFEHTRSIRATFPQLHLFAGSERYLLETLRIGGAGCISAAGNVSCALAARVLEAWRTDAPDVALLQEQLTGIRQVLEPFPMIAALKFLNAQRTSNRNWHRLCPPLQPLAAAEGEHLLAWSMTRRNEP
jgi:4-hydroxy-tetrahydrodipicolinate synthase